MSNPENPYANENARTSVHYQTTVDIIQHMNWIMEAGNFTERMLTLNTILAFAEWVGAEVSHKRPITSFDPDARRHVLQLDVLKRNALEQAIHKNTYSNIHLTFTPGDYARIQLLKTVFGYEHDQQLFDFAILLFAWALMEACNRRVVAAWDADCNGRTIPSFPAFKHAYALNRRYMSLGKGEPLTIEM